MEPASKRRRLAPKIPESPSQQATSPGQPQAGQALVSEQSQQFVPAEYAALSQAPGPPPQLYPEARQDFESFARHLQDAAMTIYRQTQRYPYTDVTVLLLRWEEDTAVEDDLLALEKVFRERYDYNTTKWQIPTVPNPSLKLGVQMTSFLENKRPDHLLIVYYAGHGYVDPDNQLYWASNSNEDAAKLRWNGVRCLFEDAQADMLLLLDTCGSRDEPSTNGKCTKEVIAAYSPEQSSKSLGSRSFTATLTDSLVRLSTTARPFTVQQLYQDVLAWRHEEASRAQPVANGTPKTITDRPRLPVHVNLTSAKDRSLPLAPLHPKSASNDERRQNGEEDGPKLKPEGPSGGLGANVDLTFDEARVLVCTTFVGDASPDMGSFKQWLHNTPSLASKIAVEGIFIGPPTMLLISMPQLIWSVVEHDKVCCFLGYINSHNMVHLYTQLVASTPVPTPSPQAVEDGRILLEARQAAANSPSLIRRETGNHAVLPPETPGRIEDGQKPLLITQTPGQSGLPQDSANVPVQVNVEDSAEMQEAAEQLKALSHVRHLSGETPLSIDHQHTQVGDNIEVRHPAQEDDRDTSHDSVPDDFQFAVSAKVKEVQPRKPLKAKDKPTPKQETRCSMCSHAPFKTRPPFVSILPLHILDHSPVLSPLLAARALSAPRTNGNGTLPPSTCASSTTAVRRVPRARPRAKATSSTGRISSLNICVGCMHLSQ